MDEPPVELEVEDPPVEELVEEPPELVDEPPVELEVEPPLEVDEISMLMPPLPELLPLELPELPKKPPAKKPPMKPPPPEPPMMPPPEPPAAAAATPEAGGNGIGAPWAVTTTTWGCACAVTMRLVTTRRTVRTGLRTTARWTTRFFATV